MGSLRAAELSFAAQAKQAAENRRLVKENFTEAKAAYSATQETFSSMQSKSKLRSPLKSRSAKSNPSKAKQQDASDAASMKGKKEELNQLHRCVTLFSFSQNHLSISRMVC
jgi:hypothetical protein